MTRSRFLHFGLAATFLLTLSVFSSVPQISHAFLELPIKLDAEVSAKTAKYSNDGKRDEYFAKLNRGNLEVYLNKTLLIQVPKSWVKSLEINGSKDDDTLTLDFCNGNPIPVQGLKYDGKENITETGDILVMKGEYDGQMGYEFINKTDGIIKFTNKNGSTVLNYAGLEPVVDTVVAANLIIFGTNGDNAINYVDSVNNPGTNGLISVDGFETIEFANKTNLIINAEAGDDVINLRNPNTPTALTSITINGNDPTASDVVIANGTAATETITVDQLGVDTARVQGAGPVPITVNTTEKLIIDGRGGDDNLIFVGDAVGGSGFTHTPGLPFDSGQVLITDKANNQTLIGLEYKNLGLTGDVSFDGNGSLNNNLVVRGTDGIDDFFTVFGNTDSLSIEHRTPAGNFLNLLSLDIQDYLYQGLAGDDFFGFEGFADIGENIGVEGGVPTASDRLSFVGDGTDIVINLNSQSFFQVLGGVIFHREIETVDILTSPITPGPIEINGNSLNQSLIFTPDTATRGFFRQEGQNTEYGLSNVANLTIDLQGGDNDTLTVVGPATSDTINITNPNVAVGGLLPVEVLNTEVLTVEGRGGDDTFNTEPLADTTLIVDGGSHGFGDILNYDGQSLALTTTSSSINAPGFQPLGYFNMEEVNLTNFSSVNPPSDIHFDVAVFRNFENDELAKITVARSGNTTGPASVDFVTSDGTAIAGTDYTATSGTLNWNDAEGGDRSFNVPIVNDPNQTGDKTVNLTLSNATGISGLGVPNPALLIIMDSQVPNGDDDDDDDSGGGCNLQNASASPGSFGVMIFALMLLAGIRFVKTRVQI